MSINDSSNVINAKTERRTERPEDVAVLSLGAAAKFRLIQSASNKTKSAAWPGFYKVTKLSIFMSIVKSF